MKKSKVVEFLTLMATCLVASLIAVACSGGSRGSNATVAFKENFPAHLTVNESVDISEYVEYTDGYTLTLSAEYTDASGQKKQYDTFGTSFMPTVLGDVTITVGLKNNKASATKTVPVKIAAPKVISSKTVIRYRGVEFELDSLKEGINVLATDDDYTFKAIQATLLGGDKVVDLSNLDKYTFDDCGTYEVKYEVYNDGGSTGGTLIVFSKRELTENEKDDASNYGEGIVSYDTGVVTVDEEDKADNSDWSYVIWANENATGTDVFNVEPSYWTNFGLLELEDGIDLSKNYIEFDTRFSKDSRELFELRFVDETQTTTSGPFIVSRQGEEAEDGTYAWQHVTMEDAFKVGLYKYVRFMIMHPLTGDSTSYDATNVYVKIDNIKIGEYETPYEYHEAINYVKTENDYNAEEDEFEDGVILYGNMEDVTVPTYLALDGDYTDELTDFKFTLEDAGIGNYRFVIGARVENAGSYANGVYAEFRRDEGGAYFAVYAPRALNDYITAKTCLFTSGHDYTMAFGVIGDILKISIHDDTSDTPVLEYEYDLDGINVSEEGGFGFWTYKDIEVACKKPYDYVEPTEPAEVTVTGLTLGSVNGINQFDIVVGSGSIQKAIIEGGNLSAGGGTFGQNATINGNGFYTGVGVLAENSAKFNIFPPPGASVKGDKITIPTGTTIIVGDYTVVFGETFEAWFNGETWQTTEVAADPPEPPAPERTVISGLTVAANSGSKQIYVDAFSDNVPTTIMNWLYTPDASALSGLGTYSDYDGKGVGGLSVYGNGSGQFVIDLNGAAEVAEGSYVTLAGGQPFTVDGVDYAFSKNHTFTYTGGVWHIDDEIVLSGYSIGTHNNINQLDLVVSSGTMPSGFVTWGSTNNLSAAGGTFGQSATINGNGFYTGVGALAADSTTFNIFPPADQSVKGDKITIPAGTTVIGSGYTIVFGETFEAWFNGLTWQTTEDAEITTTKMTLSALDSRSGYTGGMYGIYIVVDVTATAFWGGWDNSASVTLNGESKTADGWCFADAHLLYVQVTTDETANPLTIAKGTILNINGTGYEIAEDFNIYYYGDALHTEAYTEELISYAYFGPKTTAEYAAYADLGMDALWLDSVAYRYHSRYGATTEEQEAYNYDNPSAESFDLKGAFAAAREQGLKVIVYDVGIRRLSEMDIPLIATNPTSPDILGLWLQTGEAETAELCGSQIDESKFDKTNMTYEYGGTNFAGSGKARVLNYVYQFADEDALKEYVRTFMSAYAKESNFYGVMLADEPTEDTYAQVALMKKVIAEIYPDAYAQSCQLPSYYYADFDTFKAAIENYASQNAYMGEVGLDFYPFLVKPVSAFEQLLGKKEGVAIRDNLLATLQYTARIAAEYNLDFENTVQSHAVVGGYAEVSAAQLALQVNLSLAFGADKVSYFTYNLYQGVNEPEMTQSIATDAALAAAVKAANINGDFMKRYMTGFEYSQTKIYGKTSDCLDTGNLDVATSLTNEIVSSAGDSVLVNEFHNEETGKYGYYIVNITDPANSKSVSVSFDGTYTEYYNGNALSASSVTLGAGEGVFVVL